MSKMGVMAVAAIKLIVIYLIAALPCLLIIKPAPHIRRGFCDGSCVLFHSAAD